MANQFGAHYLADYPELYDPQRTNNFTLVFSGINGIKRSNYAAYDSTNNTINNAENVFYYSVKASSVPHSAITPLMVRRGNGMVKYAGQLTWDAGTLVINDYIGSDAKSVLYALKALAADGDTEEVGRAADYKFTATLIEYTPDYKEVVRYWDMKGCWISDVQEADRDYDRNEVSQVTAKFEYDKASMRLPNAEAV